MHRANRPLARSGLIVLAVLHLAACDNYVDRRDSVTFGAGDAVAANKAMQIIDPWPQSARHIQHGVSGEQAEAIMEKFRKANRGEQGAAPSAPPASQSLLNAPSQTR
jgi:hypothetical protein